MAIGLPLLGFVVAVSLLTLASAISMAARPRERTLAVFRSLSSCTLLAALCAAAAGVGLALVRAGETPTVPGGPAVTGPLLVGLAEATAPVVLGCAVLAVAWLLVAFGLRRQV